MKPIKHLHRDDKPREKLMIKGVQALKNDELMSILLGSGVQGKNVRMLAKEIISLMDDNFETLTLDNLCNIHGLGMAKASQVLASLELSKRYLIRSNKRITSAEDVYEELKEFSTKNQEHFLSITLDGGSHIINTRTVFIGTLNQSMVHPREVFADAISDRAAGIIIAHNHHLIPLKNGEEIMQAIRMIINKDFNYYLLSSTTLLPFDLAKIDHTRTQTNPYHLHRHHPTTQNNETYRLLEVHFKDDLFDQVKSFLQVNIEKIEKRYYNLTK